MANERSTGRDAATYLGGRVRRAALPAKLLAQGATAAALARARALRGDTAGDILADPRLVSVAEDAARTLGEMKGAAMKIGQAISFVDVSLIPEEFRSAFAVLQADAPPMPYEHVVRVVEQELGRRPEQAFDWFSPEPIAAASIGQVHMAHVGEREVVVKVQYPGVAKAIEADLRNAVLISGIARLAQRALLGLVGDIDIRALVDEVRERVSEELDYRIEARNQTEIAELFAGDARVHIPAVLPELSTERVLTTEYVDAMRWSSALGASEELRDQWGTVIAEFVLRSISEFGVINVDTHPGNYLFHEDGTVTFLDFGCVSRLNDEQRARIQGLVEALYHDDDETLVRALRDAGLLHSTEGFNRDALLDPLRLNIEVLHGPQPFRWSPEMLEELIADSLKLRIGVDELRVLRQLAAPKEYVLLGRAEVGLGALLAHLNAAIDYDAIYELLFGRPRPPRST